MLVSCATTPEPKKEEAPKVEAPKPAEKEEPKLEETPPKKEEPKPVAKPEPKKEEPEPPVKEVPKKEPVVEKLAPEDEVVAKFDGVVITKKDKEQDKSEIELVVADLNKIVSRRDYYAWRDYLSAAYIERFSDPKHLRTLTQAIQLKNLRDYFNYVFVLARRNISVDDISYISPTRVKVITKKGKKKNIYYNLEKIRDKWFLVPKN